MHFTILLFFVVQHNNITKRCTTLFVVLYIAKQFIIVRSLLHQLVFDVFTILTDLNIRFFILFAIYNVCEDCLFTRLNADKDLYLYSIMKILHLIPMLLVWRYLSDIMFSIILTTLNLLTYYHERKYLSLQRAFEYNLISAKFSVI